jgi:hypothetical protein
MDFEILGSITKIETIAVGHGMRELQRLKRMFGKARWRKLKGEANVKLPSGRMRVAEVHWYEAHGIGKRKFKIKRFLD